MPSSTAEIYGSSKLSAAILLRKRFCAKGSSSVSMRGMDRARRDACELGRSQEPASIRPPGGPPLREVIEQSLKESWSRLYGYAVSLCGGDREVARDLIQSSAVKALDTRSPPREPAAARAWLFRLMRNDWIDGRRRSVVRTAEAESTEPVGGPWAYEDARIAAITVRQGLERLEPAHREVIELVDIAGFRYAEAAEILNVPIGTVMSRLSRARLALLEAIEGGAVTPMKRSGLSR